MLMSTVLSLETVLKETLHFKKKTKTYFLFCISQKHFQQSPSPVHRGRLQRCGEGIRSCHLELHRGESVLLQTQIVNREKWGTRN